MKKCATCNEQPRNGKSCYCRSCGREKAKEYYKKNREKIIKNKLEYLKKTNYAAEKTPEQRKRRQVKRMSRYHFPIEGSCKFCPEAASERHHFTEPIQWDKIWLVCHDCHMRLEDEKRL